MSNAEKAKQARQILTEQEPEAVEAIDSLRACFGARLVFLAVGGISIGAEGIDFDSIPPLARYQTPEELEEEWRKEREAIYSRDAARERASGRRYKRVGK